MPTRKTIRKRAHGSTVANELASSDAELIIGTSVRDALALRGVISTGIDSVDWVTSRGGIPLGRITMLQGDEGGGKTTLALSICRSVQDQGGIACYFDVEHKLDLDYAEKVVGVDLDELVLGYPATVEEARRKILKLLRKLQALREKGKDTPPLVVILDSITALESELEGAGEEDREDGKFMLGAHARSMSVFLQRVSKRIAEEKFALVLISQLRSRISRFSARDDSTGGRAPRFYSVLVLSMRSTLRRQKTNVTQIEVVATKNQIGEGWRAARYELRFPGGLQRVLATLDLAVELGLAQKNSSGWYSFPKDAKGSLKEFAGLKTRGAMHVLKRNEKDPTYYERLRRAIRESVGWES